MSSFSAQNNCQRIYNYVIATTEDLFEQNIFLRTPIETEQNYYGRKTQDHLIGTNLWFFS